MIAPATSRRALRRRPALRRGVLRRAGAAAVLLSLLFGAAVHALPEDREQPIHITADKAVRNEKRGVTIYTGSVQMRQGTMELDADNLVVYHSGEDANKIVAHGAPARMRQQPEPDEGLVHAHANVITYYRDKDRVNLRTQARVEREDGTLVTGDSIDYFIVEQLITAESDRSDDDNKVFVVIPPSVHREQEDRQRPTETTGPAPELATPPGETAGEDGSRGRAESE